MGNENLVVIGGGAAGFFCAINAARLNPGITVTILEKSNRVLSKVKVSGGGRCNVTHACSSVSDMSRNYPRGGQFMKNAFRRFFVDDTVRWFESRGVKLKAESDGRMFPVTNNSETIIRCFLDEAEKYGIAVKLRTHVHGLSYSEGKFLIETDAGAERADKVCLAAGGLAKPESASWLKRLGITLIDPAPSLFTFNIPYRPLHALMGISVPEAAVRIDELKISETGPVLITHWGLSGPAVIKLSAWGARELHAKNYKFHIVVNWAPGFHEQSMLERLREMRFSRAAARLSSQPPVSLPGRLWLYLLQEAGITPETRWAELPAREKNKLAKLLCSNRYEVAGKTTFKEEFVTAGGVSLNEIDPLRMESRRIPGLFFAGEILDIDGVTGGFNFQACWTTGMIAALAMAGRSEKE